MSDSHLFFHSEHLTPDFMRYPVSKVQQRDPVRRSCGHSCSWQCVLVPSTSEETTHKLQRWNQYNLDYSNTKDDIKTCAVLPDL